MLRTAKPKLSLAVPAVTVNVAAAPRSPLVSAVTPISQAARNAVLNQRGASTLQVPTFAYANSSSSKSILKRDASSKAAGAKSLRFNEETSVKCVSPLPAECHGGYVKMSKDERRWKK